MNEEMNDDLLDAKLRDAAPYIDDAGFTAAVLQRLPARRKQPRSLRALILIFSTILASGVAYVLTDGGLGISQAVFRFALLPPLFLWLVALGIGVALCIGAFMTAMSKTQEARTLRSALRFD